MFDYFVNQYETMTLVEELHTIAFTVFIVAGAVCCMVRTDKHMPTRPTTSSGRTSRI